MEKLGFPHAAAHESTNGSVSTGYAPISKRIVELKSIEENLDGELSAAIYYECQFCQKLVGLNPLHRKLCEKLSGQGFFCANCLRNSFNTKNSKHILMMTFRGIIGYFYYQLYFNDKKLYFSQVEEYLKLHIEVGLLNPAFRYDPESMLWFVDFSKIGKNKKQESLQEVLKTTVNILTTFDLTQNIYGIKTDKFYAKYADAIQKFHSSRFRPLNRNILNPTFTGCLTSAAKIDLEEIKNFSKNDLLLLS